MFEFVLRLLLGLIVCYLLGSVSFAVLISQIFAKDDIRTHGSGNAGMTNMLRVHGPIPGAITFVGDTLKGTLALILCKRFIFVPLEGAAELLSVQNLLYLAALCTLLGHAFPIFCGFRGGKGVSTTLGVFLVIDPLIALLGLTMFILSVALFGIVSVSSIFAGATMVLMTLFKSICLVQPLLQTVVLSVLCAVNIGFVVYMHRDNIRRIRNGEEKPLRVKK